MALKSKRFSGDPKLEQAAISDPAHILTGASGAHVTKIQFALIELDGALIAAKELAAAFYGPSTAAAVLAYKRKRNIINKSYQHQADNIVGKMTIASLDTEMQKNEGKQEGVIRIEPINPKRQLTPNLSAAPQRSHSKLMLNFAFDAPETLPKPQFDNVAVDIPVFGVGSFKVINGVGGVLVTDPEIAAIFDPTQLTAANLVPVTKNPQEFNVRGLKEGATIISLQKPFASLLNLPPPLVVLVRSRLKPRKTAVMGYKPHNHAPCGKWSEIQADPRNSFFGHNDGGMFNSVAATTICKNCSTPKCVIDKIISLGFGKLPVARDHINWYLSVGNGRDFDEDGNILGWIKSDAGLRAALREEFNKIGDKTGKKSGNFSFEQPQYKSEDFQNAFGAIDRVDFEFDFDLDECTVWFKDFYEWHPVYDKLYELKDGDEARFSNCFHAAFVEMKTQGAKDYTMIGQNTVTIATAIAK